MIREVQRQRHDAIKHEINGDHQNGYDAQRGDDGPGNDGGDKDVDEQKAEEVFTEFFQREQQTVPEVAEDVFRFACAYLREPLANDRHTRRFQK